MKPATHSKRAFRAFTLIELLVVIAIIAILAATTLPAIPALNDQARITTCEAHLQQIGIALRQYAEDHRTYPKSLQALYDGRYLDQRATLHCEKLGRDYWYQPPVGGAARTAVIAGCTSPGATANEQPHRGRTRSVRLRFDGSVRLEK